MSRPFLLAHLSVAHIGAEWADRDSVAGLAAVVESVLALRPWPDAVLVSGDLADNAADADYEQVRELLAPIEVPLHVLQGNHDDLGPLRLVVLDTTRPGEDPGALDAERLGWLDNELATAKELPTLLAMHRPPLATGMPPWDALGLPRG